MKTIKLKNPSGKKQITLTKNEHLRIELHDREVGSRDFVLDLDLQGEKATCEVVGVMESKERDEKVWDINQNLYGVGQKASITVHAVAEDEARVEINGRGNLRQTSSGGQIDIDERVVLFDRAKAKALPVLRVETDDVESASHGASVAPIDPALIFYLKSRGIEEKTAKNMLKEGFLTII